MKTRKLKFWTEEETSYLKSNYSSASSSELQNKLGRKLSTIQQKACDLGIRRKPLSSNITKKVIKGSIVPIIVNGCKILIDAASPNIKIGANCIEITY